VLCETNELQKVKSGLNSVIEKMKILKEDQDQIFLKVANNECKSGKRENSTTNSNSKVHYQNNWEMAAPNKQYAQNHKFL
jgi:acetylglutamate synthase